MLLEKGDAMGRHRQPKPFKRFGSYHVRYYITRDGVRVQKSHRLCPVTDGANKAKKLCTEFLKDHVNIGVQDSGPMGVVEFWDSIYQPFLDGGNSGLKPSTVHGYKQVWNQHLKSHFGTTNLTDYTTPMMSAFLTSLAKDHRPRTLNTIKWLASAIFMHAINTGHAVTNPIRDAMVHGKTLGHGDTKSYTLEEMENVITALVDDVQAQLIMALCFFGGLRRGEIAGLQWSDSDGEFIHIRRALSRGEVGEPKSKRARRPVPIIQPVRGLLMLWRAKCPSEQVWMFQDPDGDGPLDLEVYAAQTIRPVLGKLWKGYHAGRRGLGTTLKKITGNSTAGQNMLGHTTQRVTEAHYEHALPEEALRGMRLLEEKVSK